MTAPSSPGVYYYGACADGVIGEAQYGQQLQRTAFTSGLYPAGRDPFNIELVFVSDFNDSHKDVMQQAARHLETIITEGLPDVDFAANPHSFSSANAYNPNSEGETIVVDDTVDDLRIFVFKDEIAPRGSWRTVLRTVGQRYRAVSRGSNME